MVNLLIIGFRFPEAPDFGPQRFARKYRKAHAANGMGLL
jgi:hypothetical protein